MWAALTQAEAGGEQGKGGPGPQCACILLSTPAASTTSSTPGSASWPATRPHAQQGQHHPARHPGAGQPRDSQAARQASGETSCQALTRSPAQPAGPSGRGCAGRAKGHPRAGQGDTRHAAHSPSHQPGQAPALSDRLTGINDQGLGHGLAARALVHQHQRVIGHRSPQQDMREQGGERPHFAGAKLGGLGGPTLGLGKVRRPGPAPRPYPGLPTERSVQKQAVPHQPRPGTLRDALAGHGPVSPVTAGRTGRLFAI